MINSLKWGFVLFAIVLVGLLVSCASSRKYEGEPYTPMAEESFASKALADWVSKDLAIRPSWEQYQFALQAMEEEDWLLAQHHLDAALKGLVAENHDSLYSVEARPQDSLYRKEMPRKIIFALDQVYPHLSMMGVDASTYVRYDFAVEGLEGLDEPPLDSLERVEIESFLDTLDLSQFTLSIELNERVMKEIHYMTKVARAFTETSLSRKTAFDSMIYTKLKERNMPPDLIYLSLVESGFKTKAYSRAKASGLWQFIPATGKRYGLDVDFWVDMRRNPELATDAALDYLSDLHRYFGDWLLAMAAYNCGEGRVRRLIREAQADTTRDSTKALSYWELALPKETMHYVPRILAAMIVGHYPQHYGMAIMQEQRPQFDTVSVGECLPLDKAAEAVGISEDEMRDLNIELNKWCTPPRKDTYVLRIPPGTRETFLLAYENMDKSKFARWQNHKVKSGENLGFIARQYGLSIAAIQSANNLKNTRIRKGQILLIPMPSSNTNKSVNNRELGIKTYKVKSGDNLASIGRKYGVSVANLKKWNNLDSIGNIFINRMLYISKPSTSESPKPSDHSIDSEESEQERSPTIFKNNTYVVKTGDSYSTIASTLGIAQQALMDLNSATNSRLYVGQKLKIPSEINTQSSDKASRKTLEKKEAKPLVHAKTHKVKSGETLYSIARIYSITASELQQWNSLGSTSKIKVGQTLQVAPPSNTEDVDSVNDRNVSYHKVKSGESLWDISRQYGVTIPQIVEWNNLSTTKVKPGEKLKIKVRK